MPSYILLMKLTDQGVKAIKEAPARIEAGIKGWEAMGGKVKGFYMLYWRMRRSRTSPPPIAIWPAGPDCCSTMAACTYPTMSRRSPKPMRSCRTGKPTSASTPCRARSICRS